jgi:hypothetical protein
VRQVATVKVGDAFRAAALVKGAEEAVGGVVVARYGVSTVDVIERVKQKIKALELGLPPGVKIVPFYDRSALIERAVDTLKRALIEEAAVVTLVNVIFLLHFCSVLIVTIPLPLAVLTAFLFMRYLGISSNIMSLAGIAIAVGVLVDAGIVVTENAFRFIEKRGVNPRNRRRVAETVLEATRLVGRPIFISLAIIILAFLPVFALTGQEGKLFHPLAFTKTFAMIGATVLSVTLVPVLCSLLIGGKIRGEESNPVMRPLVWLYRPVLDFALRHRVMTLGLAVLVVAGTLVLVPRIGKEFMPPLNEGAARGPVWPGRRDLSAAPRRLQLLGRRLGRLHRALRHGRPDGGGDGDLPGGSGGAQARGAGRPPHPRGAPRGREGGGAAPAPPQGDDGLDSGAEPAPDHVEHIHGRRGDEAAGHARARRHGQLARPRADRDAGHLLLAAPGGGAGGRRRGAVPLSRVRDAGAGV